MSAGGHPGRARNYRELGPPAIWSTDLAGGDKVKPQYAARLAVIRRDVADRPGQAVSNDIVMMVTSRVTMTSVVTTARHPTTLRRPRSPVWSRGAAPGST
ncbi:hypothetical protein ABZ806_30410 [Spirillospora sp. NPDC047418]